MYGSSWPDNLLFSLATSEPKNAGLTAALDGAAALLGLMSLVF